MLSKKIKIIIIFLFLCFSAFSQKEENYKLKTVVIDAGHGGKDPGAVGKVSQEKNITLAIALKLGYYIETNFPKVKVIYTRKTDKFLALDKRAEIANTNHADLFFSIHVNASTYKSVRGTSTFVMGTHKTDENLEVAQKENSVIMLEEDYTTKYEGYDPNSPESFIIFSLVVNTFQNQSLMLAANIQEQFRTRARRVDRGVKQAGLVVLWNTTMPSVLVETGFITNKSEEKYLNSSYGQDIIASAIFRAFREYKQNLEEKKLGGEKQQQSVSNKPKEQAKAVEPSNIAFKIQIKSSLKPISLVKKNFKGLEDVEEFHQAGRYKYLIGNEPSVNDVLRLQKQVRKKFPDAFVVAFKNGQRIPYTQAVRELEGE